MLSRCVHFRIIEPANFAMVDNTCDVTRLTTKIFGQFEIKFRKMSSSKNSDSNSSSDDVSKAVESRFPGRFRRS